MERQTLGRQFAQRVKIERLYPHLPSGGPARDAQEPDVSLASAMYPAISKESSSRVPGRGCHKQKVFGLLRKSVFLLI
jgi:hypothetical protein